MKVLIVGSGGREHALGVALLKSRPQVTLFFAPGNAGTSQLGINLPYSEMQFSELISFAKTSDIALTIIGPEAPLVEGIVDHFQLAGLKVFGPNREAAQIEGSKRWAKELMKKYKIPTASYEVFTDYEASLSFLSQASYPLVIKADGLASGKGVTIASDFSQAKTAVSECFLDSKFGTAGHAVVIESFLEGEEASIFAFCDGKTILPMVPAQDHKAIFDGDQGPNTGGMGAYSPAPIASPEVQEKVMNRVFLPMLNAFKSEGIVYTGILYAGLMINSAGDPYVVEFNCRFGDPETQVVLPRLKTDLLDVLMAICNGTLSDISLDWGDDYVVAVVLASSGYPNHFEKGFPISGIDPALHPKNVSIIHAATTRSQEGLIITNGGRVLSVVAQASTLPQAISDAYEAVAKIDFTNQYYRRDIAQRQRG